MPFRITSRKALISSTYEQANGKGKKAKTAKITTWSIRADVVRKLDRGEPEPQAPAELKKHLQGRSSGYLFETRNGTPLRLSNVLEDKLQPILRTLKLAQPGTGMHAFRRGRISHLVYSGVSRQIIRDWCGHSSDKNDRSLHEDVAPASRPRNGESEAVAGSKFDPNW